MVTPNLGSGGRAIHRGSWSLPVHRSRAAAAQGMIRQGSHNQPVIALGLALSIPVCSLRVCLWDEIVGSVWGQKYKIVVSHPRENGMSLEMFSSTTHLDQLQLVPSGGDSIRVQLCELKCMELRPVFPVIDSKTANAAWILSIGANN
jgi:hypothetical protein